VDTLELDELEDVLLDTLELMVVVVVVVVGVDTLELDEVEVELLVLGKIKKEITQMLIDVSSAFLCIEHQLFVDFE